MNITQLVIQTAARYGLEFVRPQCLRFLWLIIPVWLVSALAWRRTSSWRLAAALFLRSLVLLLALAALCGVCAKRYEKRAPTIIAVVDVSDSMGDEGRAWGRETAEEILGSAGENCRRGVILFAEESEMKEPVSETLGEALFGYGIPTGATDIAAAMGAASLAFPPAGPKRLLLFSDGNETKGNARAMAEQVSREDIRADCFSPPQRDIGAISVKKIDLPEEVDVSEKFVIRVLGKNHGERDVRAHLLLRDGEETIKRWTVALRPGTNAFEIPYRISSPGVHGITASLTEEGAPPVSGRGAAATAPLLVVGSPRVLCLSGTTVGKNFLTEALTHKKIDVRVGGPESIPSSMDGLLAYECVILSNIPRSSLSDENMELLERYVRDYGGGLIMLGGEGGFGPGGYRGTPIEGLLPVRADKSVPFSKDKLVRLCITLVIDKSGSMGFGRGGKIIAARRAAEELVKQLKPNDMVGVIPFDILHRVLVPLGPVGDSKPFIIDRIRMLQAGGGTLISGALMEALKESRAARASVKHVILLTDGRTEDLRKFDYRKLIRAFADSEVSVSTVGRGGDSDSGFLRAVARGTGGDYYYVKDASTLPIIVIEDARKVLDKSGFLEETISPKTGMESQMLTGIQAEQIPKLLGYVITEPKKRAEVALYTDIRGLRDPLLAGWRYGLGKVVAFTSDAEARWSREMVGWRMFSKFWGQVLRWTMRERSASHYLVRLKEEGDKQYLELQDFTPLEGESSFRVELKDGGGGDKAVVKLRQTAPRIYRGELGRKRAMSESVVVERLEGGKMADRKEVPLFRQAITPVSTAETAAFGNNEELLQAVAAVTGGRLNPDKGELLFQPEKVHVRRGLLPWLVPFIFLFLLADIALRKWGT